MWKRPAKHLPAFGKSFPDVQPHLVRETRAEIVTQVKRIFDCQTTGVPLFLEFEQQIFLSDRHNTDFVLKMGSIEAKESSPELQHTTSVKAKLWPTSLQLLRVLKSEVPDQDFRLTWHRMSFSVPIGKECFKTAPVESRVSTRIVARKKMGKYNARFTRI